MLKNNNYIKELISGYDKRLVAYISIFIPENYFILDREEHCRKYQQNSGYGQLYPLYKEISVTFNVKMYFISKSFKILRVL